MTKQEEIEEIKQVLIKTCKRCRSFEEDYMQSNYAKALYNAGYRKITDKERAEFEEEIVRLKKEINRLERVINDQNELCWSCKKSVKEFAEKLKEYINNKVIADFDDSDSVKYYTIDLDEFESEIDELLKEYKYEKL